MSRTERDNERGERGPWNLVSDLPDALIEEEIGGCASAEVAQRYLSRSGRLLFGLQLACRVSFGDAGDNAAAVAAVLEKLYRVYAENDGELVEVNPLAVTGGGELMALDCKFTLEDSGAVRQPDLREKAAPENP